MHETSAPRRGRTPHKTVPAARRARGLGAAGLAALAATTAPAFTGCDLPAPERTAAAHDAAPQRDTADDTDVRAERGARATRVPAAQQAKPDQTETPVDGDIRSRIVGLERLPTGNWRIRLENGQVWQQRGGEQFPLREGNDVRIYESRFGGYRLEAEPTRGFIDVERVP